MKIGSLFAGIGGFDLAARWMGWRTAWVSEIHPYASAVLRQHFPDAPNHGDITHINGAELESVDIICGGFPCQDISLIGRGAGLDGERSGLWFHFARIVADIRPRYVVVENVSALRTRGLDRVLGSLAALGYDAEWHCIPASYVGAPHRRDRVWIIAHVADAIGPRLEGHAGHGGAAQRQAARGSTGAGGIRGRTDPPQWWASEPRVGRVAHGIPARVDRIKCLGNSIVPHVAFGIFQAIEAAELIRNA